MTDHRALRTALLELHKELLEAQRTQTERFGGRMSGAEVLQAASDDLRFAWLRKLSALIAELDEALAEGDDARADAASGQVGELLDPPDPAGAFGARYLQVLQDSPGAVLAHRDVTAVL